MSVRRSLAWTYSAQLINFVIAFGSSIVVARLVSPRDFGIYGMAAAITTIINVFVQFGLAKYIMREDKPDSDLLRSLFWANAILTFVYVVIILIGAAISYKVTATPEVGRFLIVFALFPAISMFEFIPNALCAREMRFGLISVVSVMRAATTMVTTVGMAYLGFAYMSFAWAPVLAASASTIVYNFACFRPDVWRPRFAGFRAIFGFGAQMIGIGGLGQLSSRAGDMALGSLLGLSNLGLFTRATSLPGTLFTNIYGLGTNVLFARMSQELRERGEFHHVYIRFMRIILAVLVPLLIGMAILAQPIVYVLYGAKWSGAATPMALILASVAMLTLIGMCTEVFVLRHETQRQVKIESFRATLGFILIVAGALISLPFAAAGKLVEAVVGFLLYRKPMERLLGGPAGQLGRMYREVCLLTVTAATPSAALMIWTRNDPTTSMVSIAGAVGIGILAWTTLLIMRGHPLRQEIERLLKPFLSTRTASA